MRIKLKDDFSFGTHLNQVEVPAALRKKVSSGVDFFDTALGGQGFTPGAVTLFTVRLVPERPRPCSPWLTVSPVAEPRWSTTPARSRSTSSR